MDSQHKPHSRSLFIEINFYSHVHPSLRVPPELLMVVRLLMVMMRMIVTEMWDSGKICIPATLQETPYVHMCAGGWMGVCVCMQKKLFFNLLPLAKCEIIERPRSSKGWLERRCRRPSLKCWLHRVVVSGNHRPLQKRSIKFSLKVPTAAAAAKSSPPSTRRIKHAKTI